MIAHDKARNRVGRPASGVTGTPPKRRGTVDAVGISRLSGIYSHASNP